MENFPPFISEYYEYNTFSLCISKFRLSEGTLKKYEITKLKRIVVCE